MNKGCKVAKKPAFLRVHLVFFPFYGICVCVWAHWRPPPYQPWKKPDLKGENCRLPGAPSWPQVLPSQAAHPLLGTKEEPVAWRQKLAEVCTAVWKMHCLPDPVRQKPWNFWEKLFLWSFSFTCRGGNANSRTRRESPSHPLAELGK